MPNPSLTSKSVLAPDLTQTLNRADTWQGFGARNRSKRAARKHSYATGFNRLDKALHLGGWPVAALTEIHSNNRGQGEVSLLLPLLAHISQTQVVFLVNPPFMPCVAGWAASGVDLTRLHIVEAQGKARFVWAVSQIMGSAGVCLAWPDQPLKQYAALRKLQLAAAQGQCLGFLYRSMGELRKPSPAALRLVVEASGSVNHSLQVAIHKQRAGAAGQAVNVHRPQLLNIPRLSVSEHSQEPMVIEGRVEPMTNEHRLWH